MSDNLITLATARCYLNDISLQADLNDAFAASRLDRAMQPALREAVRKCPFLTKTSATKTVTADNPKVDITSMTHFTMDRFNYAQIQYVDQGTWTDGTAYSVNDAVQGDGDPDSKFYRCTTAHTAAEGTNDPGLADGGGDGFWTRIPWLEGYDLEAISYESFATLISDQKQSIDVPYPSDSSITRTETDLPEYIAFKDSKTAYLYPVPDGAYTLRVYYHEPLLLRDSSDVVQTWVFGDIAAGLYTINIPADYIYPLLDFGAAPRVTHSAPGNRINDSALAEFRNHLEDLKAEYRGPARSVLKNPCEY